MRTHFLSEIDVAGRECALARIPEFDFYKVSRLRRLSYEQKCDIPFVPVSADLEIVFCYNESESGPCYDVKFRFLRIHYALLPVLAPTTFVSEIEVEDVRRDQVEGIRYRFKSYGSSNLEILAEDLEILDCSVST